MRQSEAKESNRFQRLDARLEKVGTSHTPKTIAKIHHNFNKSGKAIEGGGNAVASGEEEGSGSPNSLRKLYVSPIRRY